MNRNPLSNHGEPRINAVESSEEMQVKRSVKDVRMPMKLVHEVLVKVSQLESCQRKEEEVKDQEKCFCQYYRIATGHAIQECPNFLELIQEMMNDRELEFCGKMEEQNVSVLLKEVAPKPLIIYYRGGGQQATKETPYVPTPRLVVKVPTPFRYTSDKAVPWNYSSQAVMQEPHAVVEEKPKKSVHDIARTRGTTCSSDVMPRLTQKQENERVLLQMRELK